jgi:hypothetical protein
MKRVVVALVLALLAVPAMAQVEIRGLTIAAPDKPGNGGIMLKSVISTRLPKEISVLWKQPNGIFVRLGNDPYKIAFRNGELVYDRVPEPLPAYVLLSNSGDLDGDGTPEDAKYEDPHTHGRLLVFRRDNGKWREIASIAGYGAQSHLAFADLARSGRPQIIAVGRSRYCLHVLSYAANELTDIGVLSCGSSFVGDFVVADIDNDGREDLIVARQPDRIEIFLR